jgi:heavy metal translocating P-type ATPase
MPIAMVLLTGGAIYLVAQAVKSFLHADPPPDEPFTTTFDESVVETPPDESPAPEVNAAEREVNHYLAVSCGGLALATAGALVWPPFQLYSTAVLLYAAVPLFKGAYKGVVEERRVRASLLDCIAVAGGLMAGFYVASALSASIYYVGRKLLLETEDRSRQKLVDILGEQQRFVWLVKDGVEVEFPVEQLQPGDIIAVRAGQIVPVDGFIREGVASIDQHKLTGESQPAEKGVGDWVLAATFVEAGRILVAVEKSGASTTVAEIGRILNQTADYRVEMESRGERLGDASVLPILGIAAAAFAFVGTQGTIVVLSSNFSECLRIAVPLAMLNFLDKAMKRGILIKDGRVLELLSDVDTVVFDKTGTLTAEQPHVGDIHALDGMSPDTLLTYAAIAEAKQTHPIACAILREANQRGLSLATPGHTRYQVGYGIEAETNGLRIRVGSARFMNMCGIAISSEVQSRQTAAEEQGFSMVYVALDDDLRGVIEIRPTLRPEVPAVIKALRDRGLSLVILSGDHEAPTKHLAAELGIDQFFAEVLPQDKAALVERLQRDGRKVCFVGDGINDAIALKTANASISLRGATTVATDTAQVVLMDGSLTQLPRLFAIAADFGKNMRVSTMTTVVPAVISVAGVFLVHLGIYSSIMLFNASLVASVMNAMRPALQPDEAR